VQNQNWILEDWERVANNQKTVPQNFMDAASKQGRLELAKMGYELAHMIVYDGQPQYNPSETGAYDLEQKKIPSETAFLERNGYPGWKPEYGTKCRGPLPPTSRFTQVNDLGRQAFEDLGLDMRFYGRIWEFANQWWWQVQGWGGRGLDCTHSAATSSGMSCVHKYFLMAMVDDHYEDLK
jgi:hypothetical protein